MAFRNLPEQADSEAVSPELEAQIIMQLNTTHHEVLHQLTRLVKCANFVKLDDWVLVARVSPLDCGFLVYSISANEFFTGYLVGQGVHQSFKQIQQACFAAAETPDCVFQPSWQTVYLKNDVLELFEFKNPILLKSTSANARFYLAEAVAALEEAVGEKNACFTLNSISFVEVPGTWNVQIQFIDTTAKATKSAFQLLASSFGNQYFVQNATALRAFVRDLSTVPKTVSLIRQLHEKALAQNQYRKFQNSDADQIFSLEDAQRFMFKLESQEYSGFENLKKIVERALKTTYGYSIGYAVNLLRQLITHAPEILPFRDETRLEREAVWTMMELCEKFLDHLFQLYICLA